MLGEDKDSRIIVLSDRAEATFRINFTDTNRQPLDILMADFIDEKSARAKGKRVTTLDVASIEDITPEPEPESEPEVIDEVEYEVESSQIPDKHEAILDNTPNSIEVEGVPMTIERPKDTQLDLF